MLIGSNDASTLRDDVAGLMGIIGIPRNHAQPDIVNFRGAYFHPMTYHIQRADGSQVEYVGSANLTASGLALYVEGGIALDTNEGDDPKYLSLANVYPKHSSHIPYANKQPTFIVMKLVKNQIVRAISV